MLDLQSFPLWINLALFAVAAGIVWLAGIRLAHYADNISNRTGLEAAFVGVVFLAVATSLPDSASVLTGAASGDAPLAVNNLLGGIVIQTSILVVADIVSGGKALTHFVAKSVLILEGLLVVMLLGVALTGIGVGDTQLVFHIGVWPLLIFVLYLIGLYLVHVYQWGERWKPVDLDEDEMENVVEKDNGYERWSNRRMYLAFVGTSAVILVAGIVLGRTGDALASQTGLGGSFTGVTFLALATSLPEISTTVSAARLGAYTLAISNIFGSTMLLPAVLFPADLMYRPGPILDQIGRDAILAAGAGILVTAIYLIGLVEHRDRAIARVGLDSAAVMVVFALSLLGQYLLR